MNVATSQFIGGAEIALAGEVIHLIRIADIEVGKRIGYFHPLKAAAFGRLIVQGGQRDPIKVVAQKGRGKLPYRLITGLHRLKGMQGEGLELISAAIVDGDEAALRDIEASENLHRRDFGPIERACFVAALADAAQARVAALHGTENQQAIAVKARWDRQQFDTIAGLNKEIDMAADDTAAKFAAVYSWADEAPAPINWHIVSGIGVIGAAILLELIVLGMVILHFAGVL